jgi:diacylglycerol kinase family enzyme
VPQVLAGRHLADSRVIHFRCRSVRIEADPLFRYNRDGESWAAGNAAFEIDPDALPFVRP